MSIYAPMANRSVAINAKSSAREKRRALIRIHVHILGLKDKVAGQARPWRPTVRRGVLMLLHRRLFSCDNHDATRRPSSQRHGAARSRPYGCARVVRQRGGGVAFLPGFISHFKYPPRQAGMCAVINYRSIIRGAGGMEAFGAFPRCAGGGVGVGTPAACP